MQTEGREVADGPVRPSVGLSVGLSVCLSVGPSVCLSVCLSVGLSVGPSVSSASRPPTLTASCWDGASGPDLSESRSSGTARCRR